MAAGEPGWVRPVSLHVASLFGVALMAFGAIGLAMGLVHVAAPDLAQSDPVGRLARTLVNVVEVAVPLDQLDESGQATAAVEATKSQLRREARHASANDLMRAAVMMLVGGFVYRYHERQINPPSQPPANTWAPPAQPPSA